MATDRSALPIRREAFAGVANRTLDGSKPDWNLMGIRRPRKEPPTSC